MAAPKLEYERREIRSLSGWAVFGIVAAIVLALGFVACLIYVNIYGT